MRLRRRKTDPSRQTHPSRQLQLTTTGALLTDEVAAFLAGVYPDHCEALHCPVPGWAWINRFAHGDLASIVTLRDALESDPDESRDVTDESWRNAQRLVARALLPLVEDDPDALARIQKSTLVSLEDLLIELDAEGELTTLVFIQTVREALRSSIA